MTERRHHRPLLVPADQMEIPGVTSDPATVLATAHETAAALVHRGRAADDPDVTRRLVHLVDQMGLAEVAMLWAQRPARSLPGALWRLYALREWIMRDPETASRRYRAGLPYAEVSGVIAGVAEPPGPDQVRTVADEILRGVYEGDVAIALDRAAAFCRIVAAGAADEDDPTEARRGAALLVTGEDLAMCARLWREGSLT